MPPAHRMQTFQITHAGMTWSGEWSISNGVVRVDSAYGSASRELVGRASKAQDLAELLLRELVLKWPPRS